MHIDICSSIVGDSEQTNLTKNVTGLTVPEF